MTHTNLTLTDQDTRNEAVERLTTYSPFQATGYDCTTDMLFDVLVKAAVTKQTIEAVCQDLDVVGGETIRGYLKEQVRVDDLHGLERQVNEALVAGLPRRIRKPKLEVAIDLHDEPFYGHEAGLVALTCGGRANKGTTRFFRLATAYLIFKDMRLTLGLLFVRPEDDLAELVAALLRRLRILGLKIKRLYLDKGFCAIPVLRYLQHSGWPTIVACPIRGKSGGTRALCQGRASYRTEHTFKSHPYGAYTVPVAIVRTYTSRRRSQRKKRRATWLVFVILNCRLHPNTVRKYYRRRFGIETSYRCMRQVRAWTTSRNGALRFWLMSLGFILVNLWIELRWRFCQLKQQGRRQINIKRFELQRMLCFINRAIDKIYGVVSFITADVAPLGI
ncbi:MAG: transposase [Anaerolineae bacterium]|nr:transposase [Anaerolineae bacterium]